MSVKLAKLLAVFVGNKDSTIGKIGKGAVIAIISLFVAITVLIGAIFSDGIILIRISSLIYLKEIPSQNFRENRLNSSMMFNMDYH
ncbi:MAG: hypothetical protein ACLRZX_09920 [Coprobacillus cateniformis]